MGMDGEQILKEMGGFTKVLHGFGIETDRSDKAQVKLIFEKWNGNNFENIELPLSIPRLKEMSRWEVTR